MKLVYCYLGVARSSEDASRVVRGGSRTTFRGYNQPSYRYGVGLRGNRLAPSPP
jgi:hypothetical protein